MSEQQLTYLRNSVTKARIYLVAVSHISARSVEHVRHVIRHYKPDVVAVIYLLCLSLYIRDGVLECDCMDHATSSILSSARNELLLSFHFFIQYIYTFIANETEGSLPGEELRVAMLEGHASGARILCIDRDFNVTISKLSKEFSLWECLKFYLRNQKTLEQHYPNLHGALMKLEQVSSSREEFEFFFKPGVIKEELAMGNEYFPGLMRALVHERNEYMVKRLRNLEGNVVAVVGAAHVPGMCELWQESEAGAERSSASLS
ncbi:hypothetical protein L7F22_067108 [Adiantum nelumboides]|nr:hypothetical protein [Adiantum nelumboides]